MYVNLSAMIKQSTVLIEVMSVKKAVEFDKFQAFAFNRLTTVYVYILPGSPDAMVYESMVTRFNHTFSMDCKVVRSKKEWDPLCCQFSDTTTRARWRLRDSSSTGTNLKITLVHSCA